MHTRLTAFALMAIAASSLLVSPVSAACMKGPFRADLPKERLDERVQNLAHLTGCFVAVEPDLLAWRSAPAIRGNLASDALMLASIRGCGLEAAGSSGKRKAKASAAFARDLNRIEADVPVLVRNQAFLSAAEQVS